MTTNTNNPIPSYLKTLTHSDLRALNSFEGGESHTLTCGVVIESIKGSDGYPMYYISGHMRTSMCDGIYKLDNYVHSFIS